MKIIIATESYLPTISGVAMCSHYLAQGLHKRGHEVHIICPATRFANYSETAEGVHIHRIRAIRNPFRPNLKISFFPRAEVTRLFKQIKPDIVHMQDPTSICSEVLRMCKKTNTPSVITNHFAFEYVLSYLPWLKPFHPIIAWQLELYLLKFYNQCNYITFPTESIRAQFKEEKVTAPSIAISNGVNLDQFFPSFNTGQIRLKYHLPMNKIVLHVGRLDQDKQSHVMVDAFIDLAGKNNAHFVICGEGTKKKELQETVEQSGFANRFTFVGFIDHQKELPQMYQLATVFVTASPIETQGIVVLEAMASGLPVVAANAGALPELVKHGQNGYVFEPENAADMAEKIEAILTDPAKANKMHEKSLELVQVHEMSNCFDKFEQIYKDLVSSKA